MRRRSFLGGTAVLLAGLSLLTGSRMVRAQVPENINSIYNQEMFAPIRARFVRFTVEATRDGQRPCLDELEIYGPGGGNLALRGVASASTCLPGYSIHQVPHINDGATGNAHSWISNEPGSGWVQIDLGDSYVLDRVVWSRDRSGRYLDRTPLRYRIQVSTDGMRWRTVILG